MLRIKFIIYFLLVNTISKAQLLDSVALDAVTPYLSLQEALENPNAVVKLVLRKQKLKEFPQEILKFKNLQYLDLTKNALKELPDSITTLKNLQFLAVSKNSLEKLPNNIGSLKNLKYLNFNQNNIARIPYSFGLLEKLEYADLWSNDLGEFPETMNQLKALKWMDLRNILIPQNIQDGLQNAVPNAKIEFSPACKCAW